ncbi:hypothetical protein XELAEV_18001699mg [Xenopus laevis]|nr:hypothetical protein XELAEV_18001699mg [Xenopus laevis]
MQFGFGCYIIISLWALPYAVTTNITLPLSTLQNSICVIGSGLSAVGSEGIQQILTEPVENAFFYYRKTTLTGDCFLKLIHQHLLLDD